ncbi:SRPBCC family protein [Flavobacterium terrae]|uniref:Activator of Hsp90 ATPase homolog 1-like protein n=1 Tax=Flavobacterium terrae TaxID=415425 RepID=A0A1M6D0B2_9FLAO|nr:SRPBCC family protein [Flavobacterium terrae]SHI66551.1 Activator of Hsp90 ATPase homolog 1-like protein [Flavobacterium terrae]
MSQDSDRKIFSSRVLNYPVETVYEAFANPEHLKNWWGPEGFTNTIHQFDLKPGGKWILTMHGPEKGNYENSSIFKIVEPLKLIAWTRVSQPFFDMEIGFNKIDESKTEISFLMIFDTAEECEKIRKFAEPKNEENFDRLEKEILNIVK